MLIKKAEQLSDGLRLSPDKLHFSQGWLQKFKEFISYKLEGEAANEVLIADALPLLHDKCAQFPLERIYNMDETGLFYR